MGAINFAIRQGQLPRSINNSDPPHLLQVLRSRHQRKHLVRPEPLYGVQRQTIIPPQKDRRLTIEQERGTIARTILAEGRLDGRLESEFFFECRSCQRARLSTRTSSPGALSVSLCGSKLGTEPSCENTAVAVPDVVMSKE